MIWSANKWMIVKNHVKRANDRHSNSWPRWPLFHFFFLFCSPTSDWNGAQLKKAPSNWNSDGNRLLTDCSERKLLFFPTIIETQRLKVYFAQWCYWPEKRRWLTIEGKILYFNQSAWITVKRVNISGRTRDRLVRGFHFTRTYQLKVNSTYLWQLALSTNH